MFTVILLCVGLDVSQYRESGVSFSSKKTIIPLNLQMTLTKLWIKSDPQCHLADVPGGDVRQPLAVYDSRPSDQRDSCVVAPMPTRERAHCPVRTPVSAPLRQSKRAKIRGGVPRGSKFASITDPVASLLDGVTTKEDCFLKTTPNDAFLTLAGHCVDGHLINSAPARFLSITGSLRPVPNLHYVAIFKLDDQHGGFRSPAPSNSIDQRRNRSRSKPRRFCEKNAYILSNSNMPFLM
jgi:hypothetical protein